MLQTKSKLSGKIKFPFLTKNMKLNNHQIYEFNPKKKKPTIIDHFHEFCKNTTFHGLKFIGDPRISWFERIFFGIAFVIIFGIVSYFVYDVWNKWTLTPLIVSLSSSTTHINNLPFPSVTICNMNNAIKSQVQIMENTSMELALLDLYCGRPLDAKYDNILKTSTSLMYFAFVMKVSQPCDRMLIQCKFGGVELNCSEIFRTDLTDEGQCCTFNTVHNFFLRKNNNESDLNSTGNFYEAGASPVDWTPEKGYPNNLPKLYYPRAAMNRGVNMGLTLILDAETHDYYCTSSDGPGFKVSLHSPVESPNVKDSGFFVPIAKESRIRIQPTLSIASSSIRSISPKHRKCLFNNEKRLLYFATYTLKNCELECEAQVLYDNCKCLRHSLPRIIPNASLCSYKNRLCTRRIRARNFTATDNVLDCNEVCLPSCFDLSYTQDIVHIPMEIAPQYVIKDDIFRKLPPERVKYNMAIVHFYYRDNTIRGEMKDHYIGMTEFLSYIGGFMSLFMGFSFISIVEILYYCTLRPFCVNRTYKKQFKDKRNSIIIKSLLQSNERQNLNRYIKLVGTKKI